MTKTAWYLTDGDVIKKVDVDIDDYQNGWLRIVQTDYEVLPVTKCYMLYKTENEAKKSLIRRYSERIRIKMDTIQGLYAEITKIKASMVEEGK